MYQRIAIIGSCVTRDVWALGGQDEEVRPDLLYISRTSFASLGALALPGFQPPASPPGDLTPWETRMVVDDLAKTALGKLLAYRPTHLILDLIDERFDLLRWGEVVATHSWELHRSGLVRTPALAPLERVSRHAPEAARLWRAGFDAFVRFLDAKLPATEVLFHDARWSLEYRDAGGGLSAFDPERVLWAGLPANIHRHNRNLEAFGQHVREALPRAIHLKAPDEVSIGDIGHRWGLSPFHYAPEYYDWLWNRLAELGVTPRPSPALIPAQA